MTARSVLCTAVIATLSLSLAACAGPVLDDILNAMQIDQRAPARTGDDYTIITRDKPVGQSFTNGDKVNRICRVAVYIAYWHEDWQPDESLVMTLWDSPEKKESLASFDIPYTRRQWSGGMLMFSVERDVQAGRSYYVEFTVEGGDGKMLGPLKARGDYTGGQAYEGGQPQDYDLWFETHVKKDADLNALYQEFFDEFDLNYPGMEKVKEAVQAKDWDSACEHFLTYMESKKDLFNDEDATPKPDPTYDTTEADLVVEQKWRASDGSIVDLGPNWNYFATWPTLGGVGLTRTGLMKPLAFTYTKTGDEKYARAWNDMLISTFRNVPCPLKSGVITTEGRIKPLIGTGISGTLWDSISIAARLHHETFYNRFRKSPLFEPDVRMAWWVNLTEMVNTLERMDAGGNWTTQNVSSLFSFAQKYPEYKKSKAWFAQGFEGLKANFMDNMYADGPCKEASTGYHSFSLGMFFNVLKAGKEMGLDVPQDHMERLEKAFEYTMYSTQPDWQMPVWGDTNRPMEPCGLIGVGAEYFNRPDMLWVATKGEKGQPPSQTSVQFPISGYFVMRSGWDPQARFLVTRNGYSNSHYHSDNLSVIVNAYGVDLLPDRGIYIYGTPECNELTQTNKHSTICVDGKNLLPGNGDSKWCSTEQFDYYNGTSCGYHNLPDVKHQRIIFFVKPDYWVVADRVTGPGEHSAAAAWHMAPGKVLLDNNTGIARTTNTQGGNISIIPLQYEGCKSETSDEVYALGWEDITKAPAVRHIKTGALPVSFCTVLYPYPADKVPSVSAVDLACDDAALQNDVFGAKISREGSVEYVALNETGSAVNLGKSTLQMTGDAALVRTEIKNGQVTGFGCYNANRVVFKGRVLASAKAPIEAISVSREGNNITISIQGDSPDLEIATLGASRAIINGKSMALPKAETFKPSALK